MKGDKWGFCFREGEQKGFMLPFAWSLEDGRGFWGLFCGGKAMRRGFGCLLWCRLALLTPFVPIWWCHDVGGVGLGVWFVSVGAVVGSLVVFSSAGVFCVGLPPLGLSLSAISSLSARRAKYSKV